MSEITRQKIFEKLQQLDGYLSNLKKLKKEIKSPEEFLEDFHLYGLAERYLYVNFYARHPLFHFIHLI